MTEPNRLLLLTRSLEVGGAERQLVTLAIGMHRRGHDVRVGAFYDRGPFRADLDRAGVKVIALARRGRWDAAGQIWQLVRTLRRENAAIVHSYAELANIFAALAKSFYRARVVWSIRASNMDRSYYGLASHIGQVIERMLAGAADAIVANSHAGRRYLVRQGYPVDKIVVIPNGIDTTRFVRNDASRMRLREEWGVPPGFVLIGIIGRIDPIKDHATFLRAAEIVAAARNDVFFVSVGDGALPDYVNEVRMNTRLHWIPAQTDMPAVHSALDILCSSSTTEGFSNVIGEAMACSTPCVVTDVGDSAWIVGDAGFVVPPRDPQALAAGLLKMVESDRRLFGAMARRRIEEHFSVDRLLDATERVLGLA